MQRTWFRDPRPRWSLLLLAVAAALAVSNVASAEPIFPFEAHEKSLENGLKAIVIPYDSPGVVTYLTLVRTGSRNEVEPGHSGFAHFFEHMMFRGTEAYPSKEYNAELKRMGADSNGSTSDDWTRYYITGPSSEIDKIIEIESDRFLNLQYNEDDFRTESKAVLGEYNKNASNPFRAMNERHREPRIAAAIREHLARLHRFLAGELVELQTAGVVSDDETAHTLAWLLIDVAIGYAMVAPFGPETRKRTQSVMRELIRT